MSKLNKRGGFTLAELLIVIAIIAILIAIAIPVFSGQLENAKLQADHANIRSAYAMVQVAKMDGGVYVGNNATTITTPTGDITYMFMADGSINTSGNAYALKATGSAEKCANSAGCNVAGVANHAVGNKIQIKYKDDDKSWTLALGA